jgi:guanyl-specific ribonuclease Sa
MQGGAPGFDKGVFLNNARLLPRRPLGYYTETDVWPTGGANRGAERLIFGRRGEVYYIDDHYRSIWQGEMSRIDDFI